MDKVVREVLDQFGSLDILIHNAGGSGAAGGGVLVLADADWQDAFDMNLFGAVRLDRGFLPLMFTLTPIGFSQEKDKAILTVRMEGNFPGSPLSARFSFVLHEGKVARLDISA